MTVKQVSIMNLRRTVSVWSCANYFEEKFPSVLLFDLVLLKFCRWISSFRLVSFSSRWLRSIRSSCVVRRIGYAKQDGIFLLASAKEESYSRAEFPFWTSVRSPTFPAFGSSFPLLCSVGWAASSRCFSSSLWLSVKRELKETQKEIAKQREDMKFQHGFRKFLFWGLCLIIFTAAW